MDTQSQAGSVRTYRAQYVRNYRAIGVLWGIFTVLLAILLIVVFIQPQWLGDSDGSAGVGYFGVYRYCSQTTDSGPLACTGAFTDFSSIISAEWKAATFFVGFTALLYLLCVVCMLCFFFMNTAVVFMICAWIQLVATICILLGCILFPAGWGAAQVERVCGASAAAFDRGDCEIRWGYILAILCIFDSLVLCILAFVLATKQSALLPGTGKPAKAEFADERRSYIQPIVSTSENMSVYSYKSGRSKRSGYKGDFQL